MELDVAWFRGIALSDDGGERIRVRDEVLQVMYWLLAEGLAHEVDAAYVARFVNEPIGDVGGALAALRTRRLVLRGGTASSYRLTEEGIIEGERRFQEEFRDMFKRGHGECAPGCICHRAEGEGRPCPTRTAAHVH